MLAARVSTMRSAVGGPAPAPAPMAMVNTMVADVAEASGPGRRLAQTKTAAVKPAMGGRVAMAPAGAVAGKVRRDDAACACWFDCSQVLTCSDGPACSFP
jgi:hypothetical protein